MSLFFQTLFNNLHELPTLTLGQLENTSYCLARTKGLSVEAPQGQNVRFQLPQGGGNNVKTPSEYVRSPVYIASTFD